jgi:hypothetical protein
LCIRLRQGSSPELIAHEAEDQETSNNERLPDSAKNPSEHPSKLPGVRGKAVLGPVDPRRTSL